MTRFFVAVDHRPMQELADEILGQIDDSLPTCIGMGRHAVVILDASELFERVVGRPPNGMATRFLAILWSTTIPIHRTRCRRTIPVLELGGDTPF